MSDTGMDFIKVVHRELPDLTFDADNHLYENRDALTEFLPPEYQGVVKYIDINGRTKLAIRDTISDYIPNPTFVKVVAPGAAGYDVTQGGGGMEGGAPECRVPAARRWWSCPVSTPSSILSLGSS